MPRLLLQVSPHNPNHVPNATDQWAIVITVVGALAFIAFGYIRFRRAGKRRDQNKGGPGL